MSVAFLVTGSFDLHIGVTNMHKDIYSNLPRDIGIMEKGTISGGAKKVYWITSENNRNINIEGENLEKLRSAIVEKINQALGPDIRIQ